MALLKQRAIDAGIGSADWSQAQVEWIQDIITNKSKAFLQWLIDNNHIEIIKTETKSWPTINDYIKYIATTEDPMKTLVGMIK